MNLEALRAKAEAATPGLGFAAGPHGQTLFTWLSTMVSEVTGEEAPSIVVTSTLPEADAAFIAAANPQVVLALVKVVEALNECDSLSPWEQIGDSFTEQCRECGSDRPRHYESRPAHFDFCPWPKLVKAREELEGME